MPTKDYKAVLFDLDGVIADSEKLKGEAHALTCRALGGRASVRTYEQVMGHDGTTVMRAFLKAASIQADSGEYRTLFNQKYRELLAAGVTAMPGAKELLTRLTRQKTRLALVSSSERWMIDLILKKLDIVGRFEVVISGEDVERSKPAPDLYLKALSKLAISADEGIAIEDTQAGIEAASTAGLAVIGVRHRFNGGHDFSKSVSTFDSLQDEKLLQFLSDK